MERFFHKVLMDHVADKIIDNSGVTTLALHKILSIILNREKICSICK